MGNPRPQLFRGFLGRAVLTTLPVVVLAAAGFLSLRQDRRLVEHEASERAQELADSLVPSLWNVLVAPHQPELPEFTLGTASDLVFPPPPAAIPAPRLLEGEGLTPEQRRDWQTARAVPAGMGTNANSTDPWQLFIHSNPPSNYLAVAHYSLGLKLLEARQRESAAEQFLLVSRQFPLATGETGLPLQPLAQLKLLRLATSDARGTNGLPGFCSNIVNHPTLLTPHLLNLAAQVADTLADRQTCEFWQSVWVKHETARVLASCARQASRLTPALPPVLWISPPPGATAVPTTAARWLILQTEGETDKRHFVCWPEPKLTQAIATAIPATIRIPDYFAVKVAAAGESLPGAGGAVGVSNSTNHQVLASAIRSLGSQEALRVTILLTDRTALFARQRVRSFWFGSLIAAAAVTALLGFFGTWRAYAKEHRLNELKSNFVSSVSHELRAPIASVRLMAESLDRGKITDHGKQRDYFRFISQECRRLSALIENVLDFARIEQGRKQYEFEAADLTALLRNTLTLMEPCAAEREVELALDLPAAAADGLPTTVDAKALQQALVNLVDNAIKHSPAQSVVVLGLTPGNPLRLWVADHGPGIPPAEHAKIFERFYRRGSELRRETQGVGIGLSIVKHIVEAHHGRVLVQSDVGQGCRFTIELPTQPEITSTVRTL